jgi:hypothetical protein
VYLIPIVGPHAGSILGEVLLRGGRAPRWTAMNVAAALIVQLAAFILFWWFFRKPGLLRALPLAVAFRWLWLPFPGVPGSDPAMFLEEADTAPEIVAWTEECGVAGAEQTRFATSHELWIRYSQHPNEYAVLTMPGCRVAPVALPEPKPGS